MYIFYHQNSLEEQYFVKIEDGIPPTVGRTIPITRITKQHLFGAHEVEIKLYRVLGDQTRINERQPMRGIQELHVLVEEVN
jgi:hypothetical protein